MSHADVVISAVKVFDRVPSAFLAVKHASLAMMKANPECGKPYGGGSIVLVASGEVAALPSETSLF
jgi:hypothetical protein